MPYRDDRAGAAVGWLAMVARSDERAPGGRFEASRGDPDPCQRNDMLASRLPMSRAAPVLYQLRRRWLLSRLGRDLRDGHAVQ